MIAFVMNAVAQDKTTMLEVHDFAGFNNGNQPYVNGSGGIISINGKSFESWIDGEPRFTIAGDNGTWQTWHAGNNDNNPTYLWAPDNSTFTINGLFAGDIVTVETKGNCQINGSSVNEGEHSYTVNNDDETITINCVENYCGIQKVTIATQHLATYEIVDQTYRFLSGGVLPDKRKAVPYITMSFGNEDMDYAYVKYYGKENENGVKQFGSFMLTETMDDTDFLDYNTNFTDVYYEHQENWNNINGPYVLKEPVVFKGHDFSEYVPWHGTYYYFYPETNGKLYVHMHSDPVTSHNNWGNDVMFLWDKTTNDGADASSFDYNTEGFYKFGSNPQNGVRVKKNHVYFMCTTPNDPRRRNVAHLTDYTFIPDFTMTPLYKVIENGYEPQTSGEIAVSDLMYTDHNPNLHYRVKKCLGNIESAEVEIKNNKLYFTNITYKSGNVNKGGAVIVDVDCTDGQADFVLTVSYSAEPIDGTGLEVKKWDFYSNIIDNAKVDYNQIDNTGNTYQPFVDADAPMMGKIHLGQWKDHEGDNVSGLYYETEKDPGEWLNTYINLDNNIEPIFKNVYDIDGDNADMIWDTNGLVFKAESNFTGIYNENDAPSSAFQDRYIGLMKGSEFTIPRLTAGDRIVIKMGTYGNLTDAPETTTLQITNAKDAIGTAISGDYVIGGSAPVSGDVTDANGNYVPRGEYHFIAAGNGDVTFKVKDGQLLKLYTIQIYKNADIVTENEILGDPEDDNKCYILNTQGASTNDEVLLHAHYNGLNEPFSYHNEEAKTGNLTNNNFNVGTSHENDLWYTYSIVPQPKNAETEKFGAFMAKIGVKTLGDDESAYVTDYAYCMVPVGYREKQTYPYTWDFTDLKKYVSASIDNNGDEKVVNEADLKIWDKYGLRTNPEKYDGYIFAPGGQLYGGTTMFDETRGIGIFNNDTDNKSLTMNGSVDAEDGGLAVSEEFGFIVPKVAAGQAVYVHTTGSGSIAKYAIGNGTKSDLTVVGTNAFAMKMGDNASTADVTLYFKGYEINKIAVSTAPKTLSAKGWTSECRDYVTDPALTSYMTGKNFRTYVVSGVEYSTKTVTLERIDVNSKATTGNGYLMPAVDGDNNACVILNGEGVSGIEGSSAGVFGNQFHLFVPDMHEIKSPWSGTSMLKAQLNSGTVPAVDGEYTNFAFTCMYYDLDPETGAIKPGQTEKKVGPQAFYRIAGGKTGTASSKGNQGYLPILTSEVGYPKEQGAAGARFTLVIIDDNEATGIATVERIVQDGRFYNLNGQQLDGTPNRSGLYIVNGKKVYVKNK